MIDFHYEYTSLVGLLKADKQNVFTLSFQDRLDLLLLLESKLNESELDHLVNLMIYCFVLVSTYDKGQNQVAVESETFFTKYKESIVRFAYKVKFNHEESN